MDNDSKLVAKIAARSPIAFETALETQSTPADPGNDPDPKDVEENPWARGTIEQPADPPADPPPGGPGDPPPADPPPADPPPADPPEDYSGYSEAALAAMTLQKQHPGLFKEISKERGWDDFITEIDSYIAETVKAGTQHHQEQRTQKEQFVDYLLSGGDAQTLQTAAQFANLTDVSLEEADNAVLEQIIRADMKAKNAEQDADVVIESVKVNNQLKERATVAQAALKERQTRILEAEKGKREFQSQQAKLQQEKITREINKTIDGEKLMGFTLDDNTRAELKTMIFENTEIVEREINGERVTQRTTELAKLKHEFDQNIEQQVAFALLLKNGFDLSSIVAEGKKQKDNSLMEELKRRGAQGGSGLPKVQSGYLRQD